MRGSWVLALFVPIGGVGCSEYGLSDEDKPGTGTTDPTTDGDDDDDTTTPPATCSVEPEPAGTVAVDPSCEEVEPPPIVDPWDLVVEWQWSAAANELGVIVMPAVGNLTDDDGDGQITAADTPDVAFTTWGGYPSRLVVLDGADGSEIFTQPGFNGNAGVAIADVTGDGWPEVVALTDTGAVAAVDGAGGRVWASPPVGLVWYPQPTVADLDNDGVAEVIFDTAILDGPTGQLLATIGGVYPSWRTPAVADLDLDGVREIVLGNVVARPNGATKWSMPGSSIGNFAAIADVDGDPEGEVLFVTGSTLAIHDDDGTSLGAYAISGTNPGPPAVADFDGDGRVEIAIPANTTISVYELNGTLVWSSPISDFSGLAGCSGYDVDGDGAYEVLFADETDLRIYDGRTGAVLYQNGTHDSGTVWEYPVIADADNDGSAEILIASNSSVGYRGVTMFGHAGSGWSKSGPTWGAHDFAVTNLLADGTVPTGEAPSWQVHNTFRARPTVDVPGSPDPFLEVGDPCVTDCTADGVVQIAWQVGNAGGPALSAGAVVRLLAIAADGDERELAFAVLGEAAGGEVLAGGVFEVPGDAVARAESLLVRIDGVGLDCHPGDVQVEVRSPCR